MSKKLQKRENSKRNLKNLKVAIAKLDSHKRSSPKKKLSFLRYVRYTLWSTFLILYAYMMYRLFVGEN